MYKFIESILKNHWTTIILFGICNIFFFANSYINSPIFSEFAMVAFWFSLLLVYTAIIYHVLHQNWWKAFILAAVSAIGLIVIFTYFFFSFINPPLFD